MDINELLLTALRATFVYFYLLIIVRILGKREIGASTAFDLIVALMLGDVVDEIIYGDVSLAQGAVALAIIAVWHLVNSWASFKSREAWLEENGRLSVIRNTPSKPAQKQDRELLRQ